MSINHYQETKQLDAYVKKIYCDSVDLNGTNLTPAPLVKQYVSTYGMISANTITSSTNLYYTTDSNQLNMKGRVNFTFDGAIPMDLVVLTFTMPDEVRPEFQTGVTPIFSGYVCQAYPAPNDSDTNALLNQVLLAGGGVVFLYYTFAGQQVASKNFTITFDVSIIKNLP
jgi:hypothetical protein